ncbi:MAG: hypothetical protein KDK78_12210, partial [Chlamydiia bacterium]|nr:hypothetical protein [Chlamydiia bacterium]
MFGKSSLGRIPRMFVQVDQLFDSEGPLGVALAIADSRESSSAREAARHLEQTHRLLKADSIRDLESLVDPAMKVHTLNHIDRAIEALRQLREELKSERCSDEVGALARARRRLKCLRCQVVRLPFAAESGAAKDLEYVCHMQSWRWLRAVGVLVAIVATGILPAILAIIAWSLYKHQCPKETLDNLLFGRTGICYLIEDRYCDQKERALYSIDMEDRLLSYEERMQMIADWAWDFGIDLGRDAKDWYACVNNFPRFIELRTHIRSYAERLQVGRIMRAEASMLKWSEDRLPCPCCAQPEPIPVEEADEEAVQDDTAEELAAAAAFTAAAAVAAQSYDEPEEEE